MADTMTNWRVVDRALDGLLALGLILVVAVPGAGEHPAVLAVLIVAVAGLFARRYMVWREERGQR